MDRNTKKDFRCEVSDSPRGSPRPTTKTKTQETAQTPYLLKSRDPRVAVFEILIKFLTWNCYADCLIAYCFP